MENERVFIFSESRLGGFADFPGFTRSRHSINYFGAMCVPDAFFVDRAEAETNPEWKQIIPYILVRHQGKYLCYARSTTGGEDRLYAKRSIGIGGHINLLDSDPSPIQTIANGVARELFEELDIETTTLAFGDFELQGLLYDSSDAVGQVHFGIVYLLDLPEDGWAPVAKENCLTDLVWMPLEQLKTLNNLENWSKIIVEELED